MGSFEIRRTKGNPPDTNISQNVYILRVIWIKILFPVLFLSYLRPGTAETVVPSWCIHSTWGVGEPWTEQLTCEPVVLEKNKVGGGSWRNTGPCSA